MKLLFLLLVIFQFKHWFADYPLQGEYMLGKFKADWGFVKPLLAHVGVHAAFTFLISVFFVPWYIAFLLALGDATIHFFMDRLKAGPKYMGRWKPLTSELWMMYKNDSMMDMPSRIALRATAIAKLRDNVLFWWALGIDQMVHHLTHYGIIYIIILCR